MKLISEDLARTVDSCVKVATVLALILGGGWTVLRYFQDRDAQLVTQRLEAQKPFLQKRFELYVDAATTMATIAVSKDDKGVSRAKEHFLILYHGPLRMLTGRPDAKNTLAQFDECIETPKCGVSPKQLTDDFATEVYYEVAHDWIPNPPASITLQPI